MRLDVFMDFTYSGLTHPTPAIPSNQGRETTETAFPSPELRGGQGWGA